MRNAPNQTDVVDEFPSGKVTVVNTLVTKDEQKEPVKLGQVFFDERGFANMLRDRFPSIDHLPDGTKWDGDPKKLMFIDDNWTAHHGNPYDSYLPYELGKWAPGSPYPVVFLAGSLQHDWRNKLDFKSEKTGLLPVWLAEIDQNIWDAREKHFLAYLTTLIFGSDVMVYNPEFAGEISEFEREIAEKLGIPIVSTKGLTSDEVIESIRKDHFPNTFVPPGNTDVKTSKFGYDKVETRELYYGMTLGPYGIPQWDVYGKYALVMRDILQRRFGRLPWEEAKVQSIDELGYYEFASGLAA